MATGRQEEISKEDIVVMTGSEAVFEHVCQPCSEETAKEAVGFCVDCADWLCEECFRIHTRPKPIRHHALKTLEEMKNSASSLERVDKCTEKCETHDGKRLKYFCPIHDILGCSLCIFQNHRTCEIQHIPDVCKDADTMKELLQITTELAAVTVEAKAIVSDLDNKAELVKKNKAETVNAFRAYRKKLDESLDNIEVSIEERCEKNDDEETSKLKVIAEECDTYEKESLIVKSQLETFEQSGQYCNMFVALKRSKIKLKVLESSIKQTKMSSRVNLYTLRPNLDAETIFNGSGGVDVFVEKRLASNQDYSKTLAQHLADVSINTKKNSVCRITGSVLLPKDKLVLIDHDNSQVKVVDTNQNKMMSVLETDGKPWGVCKVNDDTVAVTIYIRKRIYFMTIGRSGSISKSKDISVDGECLGVAVIDDLMVVTYQTSNKMEIMDMNGSVLHSVKPNGRVEEIFDTPQYVIPSLDRKYVYVSNLRNNAVICMKLDGTGTVLHEYKDGQLRGPEQVAVDSNGMCYVGGYYSNNVHLITPDCKKIKVVLGESNGLKNVNAVCYCENSDRLYIGMAGCDIIKVFQLSY